MPMSFLEAAEYFAEKASYLQHVQQEMALAGAAIVEKEAKDELGHYQAAAGKYRSWAKLSEETEKHHQHEGHDADTPLLLTGHLRDSIHTIPLESGAIVGTDVPYAKELENGTATIPPRPFMARAGWVKQREILAVQAEILETHLRF